MYIFWSSFSQCQPSSIVVEDFSLDALEHSNNNSDEKGKQCKLNTKDDPTVTDDYKILISSLKSGGKRKNYQKVVKVYEALFPDLFYCSTYYLRFKSLEKQCCVWACKSYGTYLMVRLSLGSTASNPRIS